MKKIAIVDYGMGNIDSVFRAVEECGFKPIITHNPDDFDEASNIILPGVGAFMVGIKNIYERDLDKTLKTQVFEKGTPFLGICLGMQLLAERSNEGGEARGLGWIEGEVRRFIPSHPHEKIPHVGWNEVHYKKSSLLFQDIPSGKDFYFVHSYHFVCKNNDNIVAITPYCSSFVSAINKK